MMLPHLRMAWLGLAALLCGRMALAQQMVTQNGETYVTYTQNGQTVLLPDNRRPALYTSNFGDCMGQGSAMNVTRFDAAYYQDNGTVTFHFDGYSGLQNSSVMLYIGVFAYGESRFELTFNPCNANINSLCPMNSSVPISASGFIPVSPNDVANIPSIAYSIPDFEGQAILRVFDNRTHSEIGCYSAIVTNGASFSHPAAVGSILGVFTLIALIASIATAIYGEVIPTVRLHYAHSLSTGVVFAVWQHIFFSGALSVNWPSVLPAFWSNFAWAGGMIYTESMQNSINNFIGNNKGNTALVGAAATGTNNPTLGGGFDLSQIYSRDVVKHMLRSRSVGNGIYGQVVGNGLPLPGNYSGFAGTLVDENIPASNAFMTGFIWFLVFFAALVFSIIALKWTIEGLVKIKVLRKDRFVLFRHHWITYVSSAALRTCYLAFFMMTFLTIFQFTYESPAGVKGLAGFVFAVFIISMPGCAIYACLYKRRRGRSTQHAEREQGLLKKVTHLGQTAKPAEEHGAPEQQPTPMAEKDDKLDMKPQTLWRRMTSSNMLSETTQPAENIHDDEDYTLRFGWLSARFRRTRWWFFTVWLLYELLRAAFYGGASGHALTQVFGLVVIEIIAFAFIVWARPFEGQRLNILVVYCLGFSKVVTVALAAAFDIRFNLNRIITTAIGIVIIVIQGILAILTLIAIIVGAISSYMSVSRNREDFRPRKWIGLREKYFDHLDRVANDLPRPEKPKKKAKAAPEEPPEPSFAMKSVRRMTKIEDEDEDFAMEMLQARSTSHVDVSVPVQTQRSRAMSAASGTTTPVGHSRANSIRSLNQNTLPYGARQHRPSWSSRDFVDFDRAHVMNEANASAVEISNEEIAEVGTPRKHRRMRSRGSSSAPRPQISQESLQVGGDVSSRGVVGRVPEPVVRPRSNTPGSRPSSRVLSYVDIGPSHADNIGSSSRRVPLTPAQELEEFSLTQQISREPYGR